MTYDFLKQINCANWLNMIYETSIFTTSSHVLESNPSYQKFLNALKDSK